MAIGWRGTNTTSADPGQVDALNLTLRGHYAYYGVAGNIRALQRCTGSSSVTGARCSAAAAGQAATSPGRLQSAQGAGPAAPTTTAVALPRAAGSRSTVNPRPKSLAQKICMLRSVGGGGRRPPPPTRWCSVTGIPTAIISTIRPRRRRQSPTSYRGSRLRALIADQFRHATEPPCASLSNKVPCLHRCEVDVPGARRLVQ